jgi:outer membrane lipoprotein SlyB
MEAVTGIFTSTAAAERAIARLRSLRVADKHINILAPGATLAEVAEVPTSDTEQPGMGTALGSFVGGVSGLAIGAAATSLLIPGVGPVAAAGILATALFGAGGAVAGAAAGSALEGEMSDGLPKDELFLYEDALRKGRTVVIVTADDKDQAGLARASFAEEGAESVDAARKDWWIGLRDVEKEHYHAEGKDFSSDEEHYRQGFESALHPSRRGKNYEEVHDDLRKSYAESCDNEAFRRGYERGRSYNEEMGRH